MRGAGGGGRGILIGLAALAALSSLAAGCKVGRFKKAPETGTPAAAVLPQKSADGTLETGGPAFDVDEKTGRLKATLVLRLDYFPEPKPGQANLPACYAPFPADFDLGIVTCADKPDVKLPLFARNIDQDCYTDAKQERTVAVQPLSLPGCRRGQVLAHVFQPALRIDVEVRDVN
jgi:hypothetical protein